SQVISFTLAAHHANRVLVQQDVSILMAPGEASSFARVSVIKDNERSDLGVADREAGNGIQHGNRSGSYALRVDHGRNVSERGGAKTESAAFFEGNMFANLNRFPPAAR